jgi:uncharacterized membrane protein required for colicin V production
MEITEISWVDLVVVLILAMGVFAGWIGGLARYALTVIGVLVAYVIASQLARPFTDALSTVWTAFSDEGRLLLVYLLLFILFLVGIFSAVRFFLGRTRLPGPWRIVDEGLGAALGFVFAALVLVTLQLVLASYFVGASEAEMADAGVLHGLWQLLGDSVLIAVFREVALPLFDVVLRPVLPDEFGSLLRDR